MASSSKFEANPFLPRPRDFSIYETPYTKVDSAQYQIRLAILQPGAYDDRIIIRLQIVDLYNSGRSQYEALSYTWGTEECEKDAIVHGTRTPLTSNLDSALRHLRKPNVSRALWIDAICINQSENDEKNAQVRIMPWIYSHASKVVIWLGPKTGYGELTKDIIREYKITGSLVENYPMLIDICERQWFDRVWVVQELTIGRDPEFHIGHTVIPFYTFVSFVRDITDRKPKSAAVADLHARLRTAASRLFSLQTMRDKQMSQTFTQQIVYTAQLSATVPHDKVYGVLGMNRAPSSKPWIEVDYNWPQQRLFVRATFNMLQEDPWTVYSQLPLRPSRTPDLSSSQTFNMPSWAIDLASIPQGIIRRRPHNAPERYMTQAESLDVNQIGGSNSWLQLLQDSKLEICGTHLGVVAATSRDILFTRHGHETLPPDTLRRLHNEFMRPNYITTANLLHISESLPGYSKEEFEEEFDEFRKGTMTESEVRVLMDKMKTQILCKLQDVILYVTDQGHLGITYHPDALHGICRGDRLVSLFNTSIPFILRRLSSGEYRMMNVTYFQRFRFLDGAQGTQPSMLGVGEIPRQTYRYIIV